MQERFVPRVVLAGGPRPGAAASYRAFIIVNGWLIGLHVNNVGPQPQFYVPPQRARQEHAGPLPSGGWTPAAAV